MKIYIITGIFPPDTGGPATYVPTIASELYKKGNEVVVLTSSPVKKYEGDQNYNFKVVRIKRSGFIIFKILRTILKIISVCRKADIIFVNGLGVASVIANYYLRKPLVLKVVGDFAWERATIRGWTDDNFAEFQQRQCPLKIQFLKLLRNFYIKRADCVIVTTNYFQNVVRSWGINEYRIRIVSNSVKDSFTIKKVEIPLKTRYKIVTAARLVRWKGIDGIIEAVSRLNEVGLVTLGEGPERKNLEELTLKLGIANRVFFAGEVDADNVFSYFRNCDLYVLNSTWESFAHVVLEAMKAGIPVVSTDIGGPNEIIKHGFNGFLVKVGDTEELKRTIDDLLKDKNLRQKFVEASKETLKSFTLENMTNQTFEIMREVLFSKQS